MGRHRDSEILDNSNFESATELLGGESEDNGVIIARAGHWAVGWVETLMIHKDAPHELLDKAEELLAALERYPVVDEDDYSEREYEYYSNYAEQEQERLAEAMAKHFNLPPAIAESAALKELAYELNMQAQMNGGETAACDLNPYWTLTQRDIDDFMRHMEDAEYSFKNKFVFRHVMNAVKNYKPSTERVKA